MWGTRVYAIVMCACVQDGWSCLLIASVNGHSEVVKYLCERGGERLLMLTPNVSEVYACKHARGQVLRCGRICAW